jgi:serine/threonine-protein kinase RsbW
VTDDAGATTAARTARADDVVEVRLPADGAYLSVLRTATAGLAARLDFTLDEIEDLRIAVDEACALLLKQARADSPVRVSFSLEPNELRVRASATCDQPSVPSTEGFSWTVLAALTTSLDIDVEGSDLVITLARVRGGITD